MSFRRTAMLLGVAGLLVSWTGANTAHPEAASTNLQPVDTSSLDRLLDLYVRDGLVYYAALRIERATLDRFVASLAAEPPGFDGWPIDDRKAYWLNAYNALVLQTVVDAYPIRGTSPEYPTNSIRQIGGAFDQRRHDVAGRQLTLDGLETSVVSQFGDPRMFLALGRGAVDGGRLRSESYVSARLDAQLEEALGEFATTPRHVSIDRLAQVLRVSPLFGWRADEFVAAYADGGWADSGRSPLERAILTAIAPKLFPSERAFLQENTFTLRYHEFDWRLNDLTGGGP